MTYNDIEKKFCVKFPKKFHEICESGAMEWAECGKDVFDERKNEFINDPSAFMMINADCEPIMTDDYEEYLNWFDEIKKLGEEYENVTLDTKYNYVPFAFTAGGDIYCFVYENDNEPFIIRLFHDEADYEYYGKDFDEFLYAAMLDAAASSLYDEEEYKNQTWIKHLDYISEEYRVLLENTEFSSAEEAENEWSKIIDRERPEIWVAINYTGEQKKFAHSV
ncbi:MAG: SMI1/KNR4 family protein [Firmicutes bacterium]|nr:SMI1/KNR4 family protein [Bacillota bacterium]